VLKGPGGHYQGHVFVAHGDITRIKADALAVTRGITFGRKSPAFRAIAARCGMDFPAAYERASVGGHAAFWVPSSEIIPGAPRGVVFAAPQGRHLAGAAYPAYIVVTTATDAAVRELRAQTSLPVLIAKINRGLLQ